MEGSGHRHRTGEAVLIRRDEAVPQNARPISDNEALRIQMRRVDKFEPRSKVRVFTYSTYVSTAFAGVSGMIIVNKFRHNFRLGGLRRLFSYVPGVFLTGVMAGALHDVAVKHKIIIGHEPCSTCISIKAGLYQFGLGVVYPYVMALLTSLPTARDYYTLPMPEVEKGRAGYVRLFRRVSPSPSILALLALGNLFIGMTLADKLSRVFHEHLSQPPSRIDEMMSE